MNIRMHIRIPRWLVISAPAEAGLALGVFILPPTSSFLRMFYLLDSSVNIRNIYMPIYPRVLVYQDSLHAFPLQDARPVEGVSIIGRAPYL